MFDGQATGAPAPLLARSIESLHMITNSSSRVHCDDMHGNFTSASSVETGLMQVQPPTSPSVKLFSGARMFSSMPNRCHQFARSVAASTCSRCQSHER